MKIITREINQVERRLYKRISMKDAPFSCWVDTGDLLCKVVCLSLSGIYLECAVELKVGKICEVILTSQDSTFDSPLSLSARVIRVDTKGVAMEFCNTGSEDYMMLQTILLYHSDEPHDIASEFPSISHLEQQGG
ncbi:MAG: PilZ domain-containing protein [Thermodesulfobacteriota bacterium]